MCDWIWFDDKLLAVHFSLAYSCTSQHYRLTLSDSAVSHICKWTNIQCVYGLLHCWVALDNLTYIEFPLLPSSKPFDMHVYIDFSQFLLPYQENRQLLNIPQFRAAPPFFFGIILCMVMIWYQAKGEQEIAVYMLLTKHIFDWGWNHHFI